MPKKVLLIAVLTGVLSAQDFKFERLGAFRTGIFNQGAAEIAAHDPQTQRLFVVNGNQPSIDVISIRNPSSPALLFRITIPAAWGRSANSVGVRNGIVAVAVEAADKTEPGSVLFYTADGSLLSGVRVGALPDMLTFTPDGSKVLTANEGEPNNDYTKDPEGSVSIIDVSKGAANITQADVTTVTFGSFTTALLPPGIRIFGPRASIAQDFEPEYIAVSPDSKTAWVTLQENNAFAVLDIDAKRFTRLIPLGLKDHSKTGNGLDASDRDNAVAIRNWPVFGMYQPDGMNAFQAGGRTYLITANEGDTRAYAGFNEEARVTTLNLDPTAFPNGNDLKGNGQLGRLVVSRAGADTDGDGDVDRLLVPGARSFTIWSDVGELVWDSGDQFEQTIARLFPQRFNASNDDNTLDSRSDNKGPEPEAAILAELGGRLYGFIALERMGGVMVYDITTPAEPDFVTYLNDRDFTGDVERDTAGDLGPEGIVFIPASQSPIDAPLLVTANEVSGSTAIYRITPPTPVVAVQAKITPERLTTASREIVLDASQSIGSGLKFSWKSTAKSVAMFPRALDTPKINVQFGEGFGEYVFELTVTNEAGATSTTTARILYTGR